MALHRMAKVEQLVGHEEAASCAMWSPSGRNAVTAGADGVVRLWVPESTPSDAARAAVLLCGAPVTALAWDGRADKILCANQATYKSFHIRLRVTYLLFGGMHLSA